MLGAKWRRTDMSDTPDWVRPTVAACRALTGVNSSIISSIDVTGSIGTADRDRGLLFSLVERLAEEYDLEVVLNVEGDSFVARFATTARWQRGASA